MKVIATTTNGVLIEASSSEVAAIVRSQTGNTKFEEKNIEIGQKMDGVNYAASSSELKDLLKSDKFKYAKQYMKTVMDTIEKLDALGPDSKS